ncbi:hypothetical protein AncyloWKF20_09855 [Ancylobacter sp. WKF20]|uniref:hypothetical protein n=1 Tax=Ancylobacter sp. WKF20 TaxID=3039801 RepID=UPI0024341925|nr:hypothetical protein [Ancylobacter sp. WKF20]WGD32094.1 hypothetical protein AncyloWKF20_09855 [Ancylobacter sp. WKF20]
MIEVIMYCAIGFLAATLLALLTLPAVWRRAVRLTRRRIESALPVSMAEIQADKDEARAAFALAVRQAEMQTQRLREEAALRLTQITAQAEELVKRQTRLDELTAALADLESRHATLTEHDREVTDELALRTGDLNETRVALAQTRTELASTRHTLEATAGREEELKVEHIALTTLRDTLKDRITDLDRHLTAANAHLSAERERLRQTTDNLVTEVARTRDLKERLAATETELGAVSTEASALRAELAGLHLKVDDLTRRTHAAETRRASVEADAARRVSDASSAREIAQAEARHAQDMARMLSAEKAMLEGALAKAREDRASLQQRLDGLLPVATAGRADGALRQHISEIAAEVAQLTAALEGPGSPINALLAEAAPTRKGAPPSLADRIRALQDKARRRAPLPTGEGIPVDPAAMEAARDVAREAARARESQPTPSAAE